MMSREGKIICISRRICMFRSLERKEDSMMRINFMKCLKLRMINRFSMKIILFLYTNLKKI